MPESAREKTTHDDSPDRDVLTPKGCRLLLQVDEKALAKLTQRGLPSLTVGNSRRFVRSQVLEWIAAEADSESTARNPRKAGWHQERIAAASANPVMSARQGLSIIHIDQLAEQLTVVRDWINRNWLKSECPPPHFRDGDSVFFELEELRQWAKRRSEANSRPGWNESDASDSTP